MPVTDAPPGFTAYEAIRHRLPAPIRRGECRFAQHLGEIAEHYDTLLLDAFGVLNRGPEAIAGVPERIAALQARGKRVMVVSNAAGVPQRALMARYRALGYRFDSADVITSRKTLSHALEESRPRHWGMIVGPDFGPEEFPPLDYRLLGDERADYDAVEGFLLIGVSEWTPTRQALLVESLRQSARPLLVGNPDLLAPQPNGYSREPGSVAHAIHDETGHEPVFHGKPYDNIFARVRARLAADGEINPQRTLMVGDTLHTDILGGQVAGLQTALVTQTGVLAGMDVERAIEASGIAPDWILERP